MRFAVLGRLSVRAEDAETDIAPQQHKCRMVLAVLLRHANTRVPTDLLIEALWGDSPPRSARTSVRLYVHRLRQLLSCEIGSARIEPGYELVVRPAELDAFRFEELIERSRRAKEDGDMRRARDGLNAALRLWRGRAYEGLAEECLALYGEATRLDELRLSALEGRFALDLGSGRYGDIVPELRALTGEHPLCEQFRAQLMIALYGCGRQAEALAVYRDTWQTFHDELGIEPGPDLRRLEIEILNNELVLHHRDSAWLAEQPPDPAMAGAYPATPVPNIPRQLPNDVPELIGRQDELEELAHFAPVPGYATRIAVIAGAPGVGKTALAVHWAARMGGEFPDGALFADLRGHGPAEGPAPPGDVLEQFLNAIGVSPAAIPARLEERAALFRTKLSGRTMLVVLDNAWSSEQVRWLLPASRQCSVIVTSRNSLPGLVARNAARRMLLEPLSPEDGLDLLRRTIPGERVTAELDSAHELAALCAHLPLALRIAAERAIAHPHLTLAAMVRDLAHEHERLDLLSSADDATTSLRAAFSWSYGALSPDAARAFRVIGAHPDPEIGTETVARLTATPRHRVRALLEALTSANLLQETLHGRYRMPTLLRIYARERARTGPDQAPTVLPLPATAGRGRRAGTA